MMDFDDLTSPAIVPLDWTEELSKPDETDKLYRARINSEGDWPYIESHPIISETEKGAWIDLGYKEKFVLLTARKQWASRTRREAIRQLYWRMKHWQRFIELDQKRAANAIKTLEDYK